MSAPEPREAVEHGETAAAAVAASHVVTVGGASRSLRGWLNLPELWEYRELIWFLTWRDLKVRYKQTVLGALWAVIQPLFTMIVFSIFFGKLAGVPSDGLPYPLFSFAGLVPWMFFAQGLSSASNSVIANHDLVCKVYFPRLSIPLAGVLASIVDLGISLVVLIGMMFAFGVFPTTNAIWLPAFVLLAVATALGAGLWLGAAHVRYRDVKYLLPFLVQLWLFATPIAYPSSLLSEPWRTLYGLNPMVGVVEGFRWALLGAGTRPGPIVGMSAMAGLMMLASGALYFRRMERSFADLI